MRHSMTTNGKRSCPITRSAHSSPLDADREVPVVVPTHFHYDGDRTVLLHLARPNPIWPTLRENHDACCIVVAAVTYVPTSWEAPPGTPPDWGIPTSHYAAVELDCTATVTDDNPPIRRYLADQLAAMQPDEPYGDPRDPAAPYATELRQIRGLQLTHRRQYAPSSSTTAPNPTPSVARLSRATPDATPPAMRSTRPTTPTQTACTMNHRRLSPPHSWRVGDRCCDGAPDHATRSGAPCG